MRVGDIKEGDQAQNLHTACKQKGTCNVIRLILPSLSCITERCYRTHHLEKNKNNQARRLEMYKNGKVQDTLHKSHETHTHSEKTGDNVLQGFSDE